MSQSWIIILPTKPTFAPTKQKAQEAREFVWYYLPSAEEVNIIFESIRCPHCFQQLSADWWNAKMEQAFTSNFRILEIELPCCGANSNLNELSYVWPQGFACWFIEVLNPSVAQLDAYQIHQLEQCVGHTLRIIYRHL